MKRMEALYYGGGRTDLLRPGRPMKREQPLSVDLRSPRMLHFSKFKNPLASSIYARSINLEDWTVPPPSSFSVSQWSIDIHDVFVQRGDVHQYYKRESTAKNKLDRADSSKIAADNEISFVYGWWWWWCLILVCVFVGEDGGVMWALKRRSLIKLVPRSTRLAVIIHSSLVVSQTQEHVVCPQDRTCRTQLT